MSEMNPNTEEYNEALTDLSKARKQGYSILIICFSVLVLIFALVFFWLGTRARAEQTAANLALSNEHSTAISTLKTEAERVEAERADLTFEIDTLKERLDAAESRHRDLETSLRTAEAERDTAKTAALTMEVEKELRHLIAEAVSRNGSEWEHYTSLRGKAQEQGISAGREVTPLDLRLSQTKTASEQLPVVLAYQRDLTKAVTQLENSLQKAASGKSRPEDLSKTKATPQTTPVIKPEETFAFFKTPAGQSWSYSSDLAEFASTGLTYGFDVDFKGRSLHVPFYSYDTWKLRLGELRDEGTPIDADLFSFANYERFARSIPYLQTLGIYVGPKVSFQKAGASGSD